MRIMIDNLSSRVIAAFLEDHLKDMRSVSPPESVHALDLDGLRRPEVTFWSVWDGNALAGCGALKELDGRHGEIKSTRTAMSHRRCGVGALILEHAIGEVYRRGYRRLSLETGSMPFFAPARALYGKFGFASCAPFADYREDPYSVFMTRCL